MEAHRALQQHRKAHWVALSPRAGLQKMSSGVVLRIDHSSARPRRKTRPSDVAVHAAKACNVWLNKDDSEAWYLNRVSERGNSPTQLPLLSGKAIGSGLL